MVLNLQGNLKLVHRKIRKGKIVIWAPMSVMERKRLIVIVGPTAVGKTSLSIQLAKRYKTEIISADSRQVFREMTIGTAKPTAQELTEVRHHFVNYKSIDESYDAGKYGQEALSLIDHLFKDFDWLIMCGGSGLYIRSALEGFDAMPDVSSETREQVINEYQRNGLTWLQSQVEAGDPVYYKEMDHKNPQRLMRALEVMRTTGKPVSAFRKNEKKNLNFDVIKIGLELDRDTLYQRIDERVDKMIDQGLIDEVSDLYPKKSLNALQTVGYQELFGYFDGAYDREETISLLKRNSRRYAKRQLTWFKRDKTTKWFSPFEFDKIIEFLDGN